MIALYRGSSFSDAELIAVSSDEELVAEVAERILAQPRNGQQHDPVVGKLDAGRRAALKAIAEGE